MASSVNDQGTLLLKKQLMGRVEPVAYLAFTQVDITLCTFTTSHFPKQMCCVPNNLYILSIGLFLCRASEETSGRFFSRTDR